MWTSYLSRDVAVLKPGFYVDISLQNLTSDIGRQKSHKINKWEKNEEGFVIVETSQGLPSCYIHFWKCGWSDILLCLTKDKIKSKQENEEQVENDPSLSYYQFIPCLLPRLFMCVLWEVMRPSSLLHQLHGNQGRGGSNSQAEMYFLALNSTS